MMEKGIKMAAEQGNFNDIAAALMQGANANPQWTSISSPGASANKLEGFTALMRATKQGNLRMVKCLISVGADVDLRSATGLTALDMLQTARSPLETVAEIRTLLLVAAAKEC